MGLSSLVDLLFDLLSWLIIGRCILSFVQHDPYHPVIQWVYPLLISFKTFSSTNPATSGIDFFTGGFVGYNYYRLVVRILWCLKSFPKP